ncbi:MAG: DEAD/DEAH box helicase, partial [Nitrososphaeraceae archaeon]
MDLKHSNFDKSTDPEKSSAFFLLHQKVQRWIYKQGWKELRDIQEQAVVPIISGTTDVIIASPTASGKTEAAFLPICSGIIDDSDQSVKVLYIAPLKALINDQFDRISGLCDQLDIKVHRWHGDVPQNKKKNVIEKPTGILLITPESLEAIFCNHGTKISRIFSHLSYIVIDELHSFIGLERGRQLQSLIHRSETFIKKRVPRIGLSATLGDMEIASEYLRPGNIFPCCLIDSRESRQEIKLQLRGYRFKALDNNPQDNKTETTIVDSDSGDTYQICNDLFKTLRGTSNLIFANRRTEVEVFADLLRRMSELKHIPNEFFPHHGSLSKELREDVEMRLKDSSRPLNVICTTTLEMGIDIGSVTSIAQIGCPPSVASMRQRLGRSGRRGEPAILRIYVQEDETTDKTPPQDRLRQKLVQSIAMVELLIEKWCEPPISERLHLSTLVQQLLSSIAQLGGIGASDAWKILCDKGPFANISQEMFIEFLRSLGKNDLITQMSDGTLILGLTGERLVNHYDFYAAFTTYQEYILMNEGKTLGSIPITILPKKIGDYIIFAGKRWKVESVDQERKVLDLIPAVGGIPPCFCGSGIDVHDRIRQKMYELYKSSEIPIYLDSRAVGLLQ